MRTVTFDPETGRLRLSAGAFQALVDSLLAPGAPVAASDRDALVAAGVLTDAGPHEVLIPGLFAISSPAIQVRVWLTGGFGDQMHQGWLIPEVAAMLLAVHGATYDFVTLMPEHVPAAIATVTRLGPRQQWGVQGSLREMVVARAVIDSMLSEDVETRQAGAARLAQHAASDASEMSATLRAGAWRAWHAETLWSPAEGRVDGQSLVVVDTDSGLMQAVPRDEDAVLLQPVTPTGVWRTVLRLFPRGWEAALP